MSMKAAFAVLLLVTTAMAVADPEAYASSHTPDETSMLQLNVHETGGKSKGEGQGNSQGQPGPGSINAVEKKILDKEWEAWKTEGSNTELKELGIPEPLLPLPAAVEEAVDLAHHPPVIRIVESAGPTTQSVDTNDDPAEIQDAEAENQDDEAQAGSAPLESIGLSNVHGDNMVLQAEGDNTKLWGIVHPQRRISVTIDPGVHGFGERVAVWTGWIWKITLPRMKASKTAYTLKFKVDGRDLARPLTNVVFGNVYVCSGQSNMAWTVGQLTEDDWDHTRSQQAARRHADETKDGRYEHIRLFSVGKVTADSPWQFVLPKVDQSWSVASPDALGRHGFGEANGDATSYFSATCWFFGKRIAEQKNIPVGLISSNMGATTLEHWAPPEAFHACNRASDDMDVPTWFGGPSIFYNAMIVPFLVGPMAVSGFAWYQGEANVGGMDDKYKCLFKQMIKTWRNKFGDDPDVKKQVLPFAFVQLSTWCCHTNRPNAPRLHWGADCGLDMPGFNSPAGPVDTTDGRFVDNQKCKAIGSMRNAQLDALTLPNVFSATAADQGYGCDIHPPWKDIVGRRLAEAVLYNKKSPTYKSATWRYYHPRKMVTVVVSLRDSSGRLTNEDAQKTWRATAKGKRDFKAKCGQARGGRKVTNYNCVGALISADNEWYHAQIKASGSSLRIRVRVPRRPRTVKTSYGQGGIPLLTVFDSNLLPVLPWGEELAQVFFRHPSKRAL